MDTRNTVTALRTSLLKRLDGALLILDVLKNPVSFYIIEYLQNSAYASQLDLLVHTGADCEELEFLLESLSLAKILEQSNDLFSNRYRLNVDRLEDISYELLAFSLA